MFQDVKNMSMLILNLMIAGMTCDMIFEEMIEQDRQEKRKKAIDNKK